MLTTREAFVDSVYQDQTAQNVGSDFLLTLSTFLFYTITELFLHLVMEVYFQPVKKYIYSAHKELIINVSGRNYYKKLIT